MFKLDEKSAYYSLFYEKFIYKNYVLFSKIINKSVFESAGEVPVIHENSTVTGYKPNNKL